MAAQTLATNIHRSELNIQSIPPITRLYMWAGSLHKRNSTHLVDPVPNETALYTRISRISDKVPVRIQVPVA